MQKSRYVYFVMFNLERTHPWEIIIVFFQFLSFNVYDKESSI